MPVLPRSPFRLTAPCLLAAGLLLAGCSKKLGPATHRYLVAVNLTGQELVAELRSISAPAEPRILLLANNPNRQQRIDAATSRRTYPQRMQIYRTALVTYLGTVSAKLARAQHDLSAINGTGVEPDAINLVTLDEKFLGDERLMLIEQAELARRQQDFSYQSQHPDVVRNVLIPVGLNAVETGGLGIGSLIETAKGLERIDADLSASRDRLGSEAVRFHDAAVELNRDRVALQTIRAQAASTLSAKYPGLDWSFLSH